MEDKSWVMVVDDDRTYLDIIEDIISENYNVMLASSGAQAVEILRSGKAPDLILLDVVMPGMDGYETYGHICDMEGLSGIPVIFLTGKTGSEDELAGLELGAQDYITKPFVRENLLARIRLRLENGQRMRQLQTLRERIQESEIDEEKFVALSRELTPVEKKVARLIALGCDNQEIALQLSYSQGYVKNLVTKIYNKLSLHNRYELWKLFRSQL